MLNRVWTGAHQRVDAAGLAAFRIMIGLVFALSAFRFLANGWVERFFVQPDVFFSYWGFEWVRPLPGWAMTMLLWAIGLLGLMVAAGAFYRVATVLLFVTFTYVELIDVTNYLNHYYLLSLLAFLMAFLPLHRYASVDAWRRGTGWARARLPAWVVWLLMFQVGTVYVYAGLAKATGDWLLHAQPLNIWLSARTDTPLIGGLLDQLWVAYAFSWAGFLHDLLIVPLLLWRRTRMWAYGLLLLFHVTVGALLNIGLFPVIMASAATVFLDPDWPRRLGRRARALVGGPAAFEAAAAPPEPARTAPPRCVGWARLGAIAVAVWCAVQVAMPLRAQLYGGDVLWHEQGMRWSWRVVVREKNGVVSYRVKTAATERERRVQPSRYLTEHQEREMSGQPDLILQLAHLIRDAYRADGYPDVEVRVDALASLNGRRATHLIDPSVDLARVDDGIAPAAWILPGPTEAPPQLRPARRLADLAAAKKSETPR